MKFFEEDKDLELSSGYAGFISIEFEIRLLFWNSNFLPLVGFTNDLDLKIAWSLTLSDFKPVL